jgi:hypothetical protein
MQMGDRIPNTMAGTGLGNKFESNQAPPKKQKPIAAIKI